MPPADKDAQAQVPRFLALDLFQSAMAHRDRKGLMLGLHGFGGVCTGPQGVGDQVC